MSQDLVSQVLKAFKSTLPSSPRRSSPAPDHTVVGVVVDQVDHSMALQVGTGLGRRLGLCSEQLFTFLGGNLYEESDRRIFSRDLSLFLPANGGGPPYGF